MRPRRVGTFVPARPGPRGGNAVRIPTGPLTAPLMVSLRVAGSGLVTAPHVALPTATGAVPRGTGWLFRAVRRNGRTYRDYYVADTSKPQRLTVNASVGACTRSMARPCRFEAAATYDFAS